MQQSISTKRGTGIIGWEGERQTNETCGTSANRDLGMKSCDVGSPWVSHTPTDIILTCIDGAAAQ